MHPHTLFHPLILASLDPSPPAHHTLIATLTSPPSLIPHPSHKKIFVFAHSNTLSDLPPSHKVALEPEIILKAASPILKKNDRTLIISCHPHPSQNTTAITAYSFQKRLLANRAHFSIPHLPSSPLFNADTTILFERLRLQNPDTPILWAGPTPPPPTLSSSTSPMSIPWNQKPTHLINSSNSSHLRHTLALPCLLLLLSAAIYAIAVGIPYYSYSQAANTLNMQSKELQGVYQFNSDRLSSLQALEKLTDHLSERQKLSSSQLSSLINLLSTINSTPQTQLKNTGLSSPPKLIALSMLIPSPLSNKNPLQTQLRANTSFAIKLEVQLSNNDSGYYTETLRPLIQYWSQTSSLPLYASPAAKSASSKSNTTLQITLLGQFPSPSPDSTAPSPPSPLSILKSQ